MSCTHCPHCRTLAERANLRLTAPVPRSVPGGVDRAFYRDFGAVYAVARARTTRPVRLLCEVNPELTPSRCKDYLKRARALGLVEAPGRDDRAPAAIKSVPVDGPAPTARSLDDPEVAAWLARARATMADDPSWQ